MEFLIIALGVDPIDVGFLLVIASHHIPVPDNFSCSL